MGAQKLAERITVRLSPAQLARFQAAAERRGVEVSALVRQLALQQLESIPITPEEAQAAVADAYETAALEVLGQYEPADAPLEDQLARLDQTEGDLKARRSRLQAEKTELARQRAEAMRVGDADRAADLGREVADLEHEINAITETLEALGQTRLELYGLVRERDAAIKKRAREILTDALAKAADAVDAKAMELANALDSLSTIWGEVRPGDERFEDWGSRLAAHIWDVIAQNAATHEVAGFARQQPRPLLWREEPTLRSRLGLANRVLVS